MLFRRSASTSIRKRANLSAEEAIRLYRAARTRSHSLEQFRRALEAAGLTVIHDDLGIFAPPRGRAA